MTHDIKTGDVAVFEAENDWISKSIALITRSDVSHAALVHQDMTFAEMGLSGIQSNPFCVDEEKGRKVYFLRLTPEKDAAALSAAAQKYIDAKVEYDKPSLFLLAGYLIYRQIRKPTARWRTAADFIISAGIWAIDKLINQAKNKKAMVCSQFVYQCYFDCGREYRIDISPRELAPELSASGQLCLADLAKEAGPVAEAPMLLSISEEELAKELYLALSEEVDTSAFLLASDLSSVASKAKTFIEKLEDLLKILSLEMPVSALFVTPADLLQNASNLALKATVKISRK